MTRVVSEAKFCCSTQCRLVVVLFSWGKGDSSVLIDSYLKCLIQCLVKCQTTFSFFPFLCQIIATATNLWSGTNPSISSKLQPQLSLVGFKNCDIICWRPTLLWLLHRAFGNRTAFMVHDKTAVGAGLLQNLNSVLSSKCILSSKSKNPTLIAVGFFIWSGEWTNIIQLWIRQLLILAPLWIGEKNYDCTYIFCTLFLWCSFVFCSLRSSVLNILCWSLKKSSLVLFLNLLQKPHRVPVLK